MTHASLFSGIGGFDLAAEWMGWENIFHCEWNPFGQKVLAHHFPNSKSYNDITKTDFSLHSGEIDILTGGFPCQPYSTAGKRLGKADERHLFPHMLRCIKEVKPKWVIGENVRGLVNWNGGMVFNEVCDDLEREGYEVQPFLIPAAGVNAPHQRQRIWFVAYSKSIRYKRYRKFDSIKKIKNEKQPICFNERISNNFSRSNGRKVFDFKNISNESPLYSGYDGFPYKLDNITFPKWRNESIKAYGNAIVPQVAYEIFKAIQSFEDMVNV
jgi:DNA (cytosine-5)-methyltransferase 1